jgi:hypothetical protein
MNDTNDKCSQIDANLNLVCTPLEIYPIIVSMDDLLQYWLVGVLEVDCLQLLDQLIDFLEMMN